MTKKINAMQCGIMLCLTTISLKFLVFPSVFASYAYKDIYIPMLIGLGLDFCFTLIVLRAIKNNPHLTFFELLNRSFGKVFARIVIGLLFIYFFCKGVLIIKEIHNYFNEALFESINWFVFVVPLFALLAFMMVKDFRTFGRTVQFFLPLILLSLIVTILIPSTEADFTNLLPVLEYGGKGVFNALLHCSFAFGDYLILFLLMGKVSYTQKTQKTILICVGITDLLVLLFYVVFASIFGNVGLNHSLALSEVLLYTNITTHTGTVNWLNIIVWLVILFLEAGLMFLCSSKALTELCNFKNKYVPMMVVCVMLVGVIVYLYLNLIRAVQIVTSTVFGASIIGFQVVLPIVCLIGTKILSGNRKVTLVDVYDNKLVKYQLTNISAGKTELKLQSKKLKLTPQIKIKTPPIKEVENA